MKPQKHLLPFSPHQVDALQQLRVEPGPESWTRIDAMLSGPDAERSPMWIWLAKRRVPAIAASVAAALLIVGGLYALRKTEMQPPLHVDNRAVEWILSAPDGATTQRINDAYQAYRSAGMIQ